MLVPVELGPCSIHHYVPPHYVDIPTTSKTPEYATSSQTYRNKIT